MSRDSVACVTSKPAARRRRRSCSWLRTGSRWMRSRITDWRRAFISWLGATQHSLLPEYTKGLTVYASRLYKYSFA